MALVTAAGPNHSRASNEGAWLTPRDVRDGVRAKPSMPLL